MDAGNWYVAQYCESTGASSVAASLYRAAGVNQATAAISAVA